MKAHPGSGVATSLYVQGGREIDEAERHDASPETGKRTRRHTRTQSRVLCVGHESVGPQRCKQEVMSVSMSPIMLALSTMIRGIVGNAPNHWG